MAWLFPDVDATTIDPEKHRRTILARTLEFGGMSDVEWCLRRYGMEEFKCFFRSGAPPEVSPRTRRFWALVLDEDDSRWPTPQPFRRDSVGLFPA